MRLHILFPFKQSPWGGANQFLHALRGQLRRQGNYREKPELADVLIANLNPGNLLPLLKQISQIKSCQPEKIIIARIDGPISLIRGRSHHIDRALAKFIHLFADGIIYQSRWSQHQNQRLFNTTAPYQIVIHNAPDPGIFYPSPRVSSTAFASTERRGTTRLIATSWSPNTRKGFDIYQYLDTHLYFSRYSMTFIGNSPIQLNNLKTIKPVSSSHLADLLRQHDIYITASRNDPCSNALIEAISCGLPTVALAQGGHPELIQRGGELFTGQSDIIQKINLVAQNLAAYQTNLPQFSITKVTNHYLIFAQKIYQATRQDSYHPKLATPLTKAHAAGLKTQLYLSTHASRYTRLFTN